MKKKKKQNLKCAFCTFFNNTIDITLPSPNKARYVSINTHVSSLSTVQSLRAFVQHYRRPKGLLMIPTI